ncbi:MAG: cysteine--tRNA ligase [Acholeplasmataceae bacterium]|jgi:cysteinyl-tRNA synthetase|nr:cysteine--tRNA ligase [Acholeplasmataceae bacterium]
MKIYNSLTNQKEDFVSQKKNHLSMYVCGPTVYNYIHIGNARPVVFFDVVRRYFEYLGYQVNYVSNITDIDDKIILEAEKLKISETKLTTYFTEQFIKDTLSLGSLLPSKMPKATEYVIEMIFYINDLIEKSYAYQSGDSIYFRVNKIADYGKLSNQVLADLSVGARVDEDLKKESPHDFTLWKTTDLGLNFDSPWGRGRPGWHTECAVMNQAIFGEKIDIHGGGNDLIFPHHENEIAQSEAISNHSLAQVWMHVGRLDLANVKMSKSLGNIILVKDLLEEYEYQGFRMLILSHHYRQPINFSYELMNQFDSEWQRIKRTLKQALVEISINYYEVVEYNDLALDAFKVAMDDDFNCANAFTVIYDQIKQINKTQDLKEKARLYYTTVLMLNVLGIQTDLKRLTDEQIQDYHAWQTARREKRYQEADEIRIRLIEAGILL